MCSADLQVGFYETAGVVKVFVFAFAFAFAFAVARVSSPALVHGA